MIEQDRPAAAKVRKPRRWPLWVAGSAAALVAAGVAGLAYDRQRDIAAWRASCAEVDRADPRWRWEQLLADRPAIPDDQNAALVALRVADAIHGRWPDWGAALPIGRALADADADGGALPSPAEVSAAAGRRRVEAGEEVANRFQWQVSNRRPRPGDADALRAVVADAGPAAAAAASLEGYQAGRPPRAWSSPLLGVATPDSDRLKEVAQLLALQAWSLADEGRGDDALACARAAVTLAHAVGDDGLVDLDVALGVRTTAALVVQRTLALSEPGDAALAATQARFADAADRPILADALRWQRAVTEDAVRAYDEGRLGPVLRWQLVGPPPAVTGHTWLDAKLHQLHGGVRRCEYGLLVEEYTRWIGRAAAGPDELWRSRNELLADARRLPPHLAGAADWVFERDRLPLAMVRSAVAALAAERFRRATGRWPVSLGELVPTYLAAVPPSPYDLSPLGLEKASDGIAVAFSGRSGKVTYRLWDTDARRAAPALE